MSIYNQHGNGTAKDALHSFSHHVWWAKSIMELLEWLRAFNQSHPHDHVQIFGFDMQDLQAALNYKNTPLTDDLKYRPIALRSISAFHQREQTKDNEERMSIRDQAMADLLVMLNKLHKPGKTVIWAANGHLIKYNPGAPVQNSMGYFLAKVSGLSYANIGIYASRFETVEFRHPHNPGRQEAPKGSLEEWLESYQREQLFVDFHELENKTLGLEESELEQIGHPKSIIDGAIYLRYSPAMELIE